MTGEVLASCTTKPTQIVVPVVIPNSTEEDLGVVYEKL